MQVTYKDITINFDYVKTVLKLIQNEYPLYRYQLFNKLIEIPEFKDYFFKNYKMYKIKQIKKCKYSKYFIFH